MDNLIFDRLRSDVDTALSNPENTSFLKGAYNYTDLNRVEEWCDFLQTILRYYGYKEELVIKKDWNLRDYPTRKQIDRIRSNIDSLKDYCYALSTETIIYDNSLDYEKANVLEKILFDIDKYIKDMTINTGFNYNIGATLIRGSFEQFSIDTSIIKETDKYKSNVGVGNLLIQDDYITLKVE